MAKFWDFLKVLVLFGAVAGLSALLATYASDELFGEARVIDGDSLAIGGQEIRLFGIDAPEFNQTCQRSVNGPNYQCGREARSFLKQLIAQRDVTCEGWQRDKYDRLLGVCSVGGVNLNETMILRGWAVAFGDFEKAEAQAKKQGLGLWAGEFVAPSQWRQEAREAHSGSLFQALKFW